MTEKEIQSLIQDSDHYKNFREGYEILKRIVAGHFEESLSDPINNRILNAMFQDEFMGFKVSKPIAFTCI